jgi:predicted ribonuclease YlaK
MGAATAGDCCRLAASCSLPFSEEQNYNYFVIDTNMLLHHRKTVMSLVERSASMDSAIYIPIKVVQELDRLKLKMETKKAAQIAIKFLNLQLKMGGVVGESRAEQGRAIAAFPGGVDTPDDIILAAAMRLVNEEGVKVKLVTEDLSLQYFCMAERLPGLEVEDANSVLSAMEKDANKVVAAGTNKKAIVEEDKRLDVIDRKMEQITMMFDEMTKFKENMEKAEEPRARRPAGGRSRGRGGCVCLQLGRICPANS